MSYMLLEENPLLNARTRTLDLVIVLHNGLLLRYQVSRKFKLATSLSFGRKPEVSISHSRTVVSPGSSH